MKDIHKTIDPFYWTMCFRNKEHGKHNINRTYVFGYHKIMHFGVKVSIVIWRYIERKRQVFQGPWTSYFVVVFFFCGGGGGGIREGV